VRPEGLKCKLEGMLSRNADIYNRCSIFLLLNIPFLAEYKQVSNIRRSNGNFINHVVNCLKR